MIKGTAGAALSRFLDRKSISLVCLILFSLLLTSKIDAQAPAATFTLKGEINTDSGGVELMPVWNTSYYPASLHSFETTIVNGRFEFSDSIEYPYGFRLGVKLKDQWIYLSDYFVVEPGEQTIICNIDSLREMPVLRNKSMQDLREDILNDLAMVDLKPSGYEQKTAEKRLILARYTKKYPDSYAGLWFLIRQFMSWGYDSLADTTFNQLSNSIRNTATGKILKANLSAAANTAPGHQFPHTQVRNKDMKKFRYSTDYKNKYTLVDFWFSHCEPCKGQFPAMKKIFAQYHSRGFNVIGISIDAKDQIGNWKAIIRKFRLPWGQYLDLSGKEAAQLFISGYPTNFLLNEKGIIVARDIEMGTLAALLKNTLQINKGSGGFDRRIH